VAQFPAIAHRWATSPGIITPEPERFLRNHHPG